MQLIQSRNLEMKQSASLSMRPACLTACGRNPTPMPRRLCVKILNMLTISVMTLAFGSTSAFSQAELISDEMLRLSDSIAVVLSSADPSLPCEPGAKETDGCESIGTGTSYGRTHLDESSGLMITNKHVTRGRDTVTIFVPSLGGDHKLDWEEIGYYLHKMQSHQWLGPGALGHPCVVEAVYYEGMSRHRTNIVGHVSVGRVIAEHKTSDVAIVQFCSDFLKAIPAYRSCDTLDEGDSIYTAGSSRNYGVATWLLGIFIGCNDNRITFEMPIEPGRSGSPIVVEDGAIIGIQEGLYVKTTTGVGVPIERANELIYKTSLKKLITVENDTNVSISYAVACGEGMRWRHWDLILPGQRNLVSCIFSLVGETDIPGLMFLKFGESRDDSSIGTYRLHYKTRLTIPAELGGTELIQSLDAQHYKFVLGSGETSVSGVRLVGAGDSPSVPRPVH